MSRDINAAAVLPPNAMQLCWAVHKAFVGGVSGAHRRIIMSLRDGSLSLSSMPEEGMIIIKRQDNDIGLVIDSNMDRGSRSPY